MPTVSPTQGASRFQNRARFDVISSTRRVSTPAVTVADVWCRAGAGSRSCEEDSPAWTLVIPRRGVFVWEVQHQRVLAEPNVVLLFRPGQPHHISHPVAGGDACVAVRLGADWVESIQPRTQGAPQHWILDGPSQRAVHEAAHSFDDAQDELHAEETLTSIIGTIARSPACPNSRHRRVVDAVRERIASDPSAHVTAKKLAAGSGLSPYELARRFRAHTGSSIHQYRLRLRLLTALGRLREGAADLTQLALDVGFSSHAHFTSAFRAMFGRPPSAARAGLVCDAAETSLPAQR